MTNRILEIVVLLMDYIRDNQGHPVDSDDLSMSLRSLGYSDSEISSAYSWLLERFEQAPEQHFSQLPERSQSIRVLTPVEQAVLTVEGQSFILKLYNGGIIDDQQFEELLDRISILGSKPVTLEQVKLIASTVLFQEFEEADLLSMLEAGEELSHSVN